jgi:hypothetical protein
MVISQKAKNIFNRLYLWCVADNFIVNYDFLVIIMFVGAQCLPVRACLCVYARRQVRTQTGIVPLPYYYLISPVGTMSTCACTHADRHRAPTLPFPDQVEDRFVSFLGYNHNITYYKSKV